VVGAELNHEGSSAFIPKEVFVLLVEDSPTDAELIERELRRGGIGIVLKRLDTEAGFTQVIKDSPPDLILADYHLTGTGFNGIAALATARRQCPDIPFILISGVCGEELAVEALTGGAADYILKDRLYRLVPAVRHALEIADRRRTERAARETEKKFFALTETLPAIVFVHQDGKFRYLNPAAEQILGYSTSELLGTNFWDVIHPDHREIVRRRGLTRQEGEAVPARYEFPIISSRGETRWLDCTATRIEFDGQPAVLGSALDITERLRTEQALRESEQKTRALVDAIPDFIFRLRGDGTILDFKAPKEAHLSISSSALLGKVLLELAPETLAEPTRYYLERTLQTGEVHYFDFQFPLGSQVRDFEARVTVCGANEVMAIVRDVTEHKRLEEEVLEISARERRRIGDDLHDGLGQYLAGIAVKAKILADDLAVVSSPHKPKAEKLVRLIDNAIQQARTVARGLDPIELEADGLEPALQNLACETEELYRVACVLRCDQPVLPINKNSSLHLYRIAQEGINNAVKHGKPGRIEISLATLPSHLRLRIKDDGRGFRIEAARRGGMGLRIMQYRAHVIGGVLTIQSRPKRGTEVQCLVPTPQGVGLALSGGERM
jgi:PAS domain S-box-containing protein